MLIGRGLPRTPAVPPLPTVVGDYSTTFHLTENPINESSHWVNGQETGNDWSNVQTGSGNAYGARFVDFGGVGRYADCIAHISSSFLQVSANQFVEATVHRAEGYSHLSTAETKHEIELLLRFAITAGNARGYEILISRDDWVVLVRWNGPYENYTELTLTDGPISPVIADGDVFRAEINGYTIDVYRNTVLILTYTDNSGSHWSDGQPGIGFWPVGTANDGSVVLSSYGWKDFVCGDL